MTIQFNVKNPEGIKSGDLLIYNGKNFEVITKKEIVSDLQKDLEKLKNEIEILKQQSIKVKETVNTRQKRFLKAFLKEVK
jgi:chaperonin cofactor prefoldin